MLSNFLNVTVGLSISGIMYPALGSCRSVEERLVNEDSPPQWSHTGSAYVN